MGTAVILGAFGAPIIVASPAVAATQVSYSAGRLTISEVSDLEVECVLGKVWLRSFDGGTTYAITGAPDGVPCIDVTAIEASGTEGPDRIDLSVSESWDPNQSATHLPNVATTVINGGSGNDQLTASSVTFEPNGDFVLDAGTGADDVSVEFWSDPSGYPQVIDVSPTPTGIAARRFFWTRASFDIRGAERLHVSAGQADDYIRVRPSATTTVTIDAPFDLVDVDNHGLPYRVGGTGIDPRTIAVQGYAPVVPMTLEAEPAVAYDFRLVPYIDAAHDAMLGRISSWDEFEPWAIALVENRIPRSALPVIVTGSADYRSHVVSQIYEEVLRRGPDSGGSTSWQRVLQSGATSDAVRAGLFGSREYLLSQGGGGDNGRLIDAFYRDIIRRPADPSGKAYFVGKLDAGATRSSVARSMLASREAIGKRIRSVYEAELGRSPGATEISFWTNRYLVGGERSLLTGLVSSNEYLSRQPVGGQVRQRHPFTIS